MTKYKVGLTGLIGSGKSLAANYFADLGIEIIDTDAISHSITRHGGEAIPAIVKDFGSRYLTRDGTLDRDKIRDLVFNNVEEKHKLEAILHPLIFDEVKKQVDISQSRYTIIVVPLLFQSPRYAKYVDRSIFVDCDEDMLVSRIIKRNGWSRDIVLAILRNQMPRALQLEMADDIINNNETLLNLELQVKNLHVKYEHIINNGLLINQ